MSKTCKKLLASALAAAMLITTFVSSFVVSAATTGTLTIEDTTITVGAEEAVVNFKLAFDAYVEAPHELATITVNPALTIKDIALGDVAYETAPVDPEDPELESPALTIKTDGINKAAGKVLFESGVDGAVKANEINFTVTFDTSAAEVGEYAVSAAIASTDINEADIAINCDDTAKVIIEAAPVVVTDEASLELYNFKTGALVETIGYENLADALAISYDYAMGYVDGNGYDAVVVLNKDVVLSSDIEVTSYTVLNLGDYTVDTGDYEIAITGSGAVKANYEITAYDSNALVVESVSGGVYTYKLSVQLTLDAKNLTLSDNIFINFTAGYSNKSGATPTYGLSYYKSTDADTVYDVTGADLSTTSNKLTGRSIGIPAKDMGVPFVAVYYAKVTIDGVDYYAYSNTIEYSIVDYASNMLYDTSSTEAINLSNLLVAMLNYGSAAQLYYGYEVDNLSNLVLNEEDRVLPADYADYMLAYADADTLADYSLATNYVSGASLELKDAINIKYSFKNAVVGDTTKFCVWTLNEYNALVKQANGDMEALSNLLTVENCSNVIDVENGAREVLLTGISAKKFADSYITRLVKTDAEGNAKYDYVWSYSATGYCYNKVTKPLNTDPETLRDLCKALCVYSARARVYFDGYVVDSN